MAGKNEFLVPGTQEICVLPINCLPPAKTNMTREDHLIFNRTYPPEV